VLDRGELEQSTIADLHAIASELGIEGYRRLRREQLIESILGGDAAAAGGAPDTVEAASEEEPEDEPEGAERHAERAAAETPMPELGVAEEEAEEALAEPDAPAQAPEEEVRAGLLDILPNGSGFMRAEPFVHSRDDVYVSPAQIRRCELRSGDELAGPVREPRRSERYPSLVRVEIVNGADAEPPAERPRYEELTPVFATERLAAPEELSSVPFGRGSRVAVGGPPGAGATTLLRRIVVTLAEQHRELDLQVVLAGVRPEEVTEWRREAGAPVAGGGFDRPADEQAQVAELAVERAKRAAERGRDSVVVVDSLDALPVGAGRRVFAAARNTEEAGSVTVIAATGLAGELPRVATTRVVLEAADAGAPPTLASASGTTHAELLG
jgi:transcription termination factor Rho